MAPTFEHTEARWLRAVVGAASCSRPLGSALGTSECASPRPLTLALVISAEVERATLDPVPDGPQR